MGRPRPFSATHRNPDGVGAIPVAAGSAVPETLAAADKHVFESAFGSREKSFECLFKVDTEQPLLTGFHPASRRKWLPCERIHRAALRPHVGHPRFSAQS